MLLCLSRIHRRPHPQCCHKEETIVSQIFDALQRSESERPADDSSAVPQGTDLLRRAERRAAARWEASGSGSDLDVADSSLEEEIEVIEVAPSPAPVKPA